MRTNSRELNAEVACYKVPSYKVVMLVALNLTDNQLNVRQLKEDKKLNDSS